MHILILGGTQFVGRHIVEALLKAGHQVTTFTRGKTKDELPPQVERLYGDRETGVEGLKSLIGKKWDACVDVSGYTPKQVRPSCEFLKNSVQRYVFISTCSVYGDTKIRPVKESDPMLPPISEDVTEINGETYGRLKVTCENIVQEIFGERATSLRPQIVAGPHDPTDRYPYWVNRAARSGTGAAMLAPGDGTDHVQVVDGRDLARFVVTVLEKNLPGAFNMAGPRLTWAEFMKIIEAKNIVWVNNKIIQASGIDTNELPMYRPEQGTYAGIMDVNISKASAVGFKLTDPKITFQDTRAWSLSADIKPALTAEKEAKLVRAAKE